MAKSRRRPKICHLASLWTLKAAGAKGSDLTIDQKVLHAKKAGFDGVLSPIALVNGEQTEKHGLAFVASEDIGGAKEVKPTLTGAKAARARCLNVQVMDHDTPTRQAVDLTRRIMNTADDLQIDVSVEVHRDTCTETPEKTYALVAAFEKLEKRPLKLTWDFSHLALVKHLSPPYCERLAERVDLIRHAQQFHFRPFNGQHCQIPALGRGGRLTPEFLDWLEFAEKVIECWLSGATPGREMFVCPEQGASGGYLLSTFGNPWKDAQVIRQEVDRVWKRQLRKWQPPQESR